MRPLAFQKHFELLLAGVDLSFCNVSLPLYCKESKNRNQNVCERNGVDNPLTMRHERFWFRSCPHGRYEQQEHKKASCPDAKKLYHGTISSLSKKLSFKNLQRENPQHNTGAIVGKRRRDY